MGTEMAPKAMARRNMRSMRSARSLAVIGGATRKAKTSRTPIDRMAAAMAIPRVR